MWNVGEPVEDLLRELAPQVLATLARQHGQFDACEDATQEALLAALTHWPNQGIPNRPRAWLLTVAHRSLIDQWRSDSARRQREERAADTLASQLVIPGADEQPPAADDTLTPAVHVLSSGAPAGGSDRPYAAGPWRPHHQGDRRCLPRP